MTASERGTFTLPAATRIGRTALRVESLETVLPFYRDGLGFRVEREQTSARLVAGDEPLVRLGEAPSVPDRSSAQAGLFHIAIRVPGRTHLANALARIRETTFSLTGAADHGVSEALYLRDPEGNGVELYCDHPRSAWEKTTDDRVEMGTEPQDVDGLLRTSAADPPAELPSETDVGHVHLEVVDLDRAETFYRDVLGMNVRARYGDSATFLAAGGYHHHVGLNTWNHRTAPAGESRGLAWFEVVVPDDETLATLQERFDVHGHDIDEQETGIQVSDPDGITLRLRSE